MEDVTAAAKHTETVYSYFHDADSRYRAREALKEMIAKLEAEALKNGDVYLAI